MMKRILALAAVWIAHSTYAASPTVPFKPMKQVQLVGAPYQGCLAQIRWNEKANQFLAQRACRDSDSQADDVLLFDASGQLKIRFPFEYAKRNASFSPDGTRVAASRLGMAKVWDTGSGQEVVAITTCPGQYTDLRRGEVAWSPNGDYLGVGYACLSRHGVSILNAKTWKEDVWFNRASNFFWSPTGDNLVLNFLGSLPGVKAVGSWADAGYFKNQDHYGVYEGDLSPDELKLIHFTYENGDSERISVEFRHLVRITELKTPYRHPRAAFSPDSNHLLVTEGPRDSIDDQPLDVAMFALEGSSVRELWRKSVPGGASGVVWSPDGETVLLKGTRNDLSGFTRIMRVFSARSGDELQTLPAVDSVQFVRPDLLMSANSNGEITFWQNVQK